MFKKVSMLAVALMITVPAFAVAKDLNGRFGIGYFHNDAPVGFRYWASEKLGIDIGIGFDAQNVYSATQVNGETQYDKELATSFWVEVGAPFIVVPTERANFFVRPGVIFASLDNRSQMGGGVDASWTRITLLATPGVEVFFGDHFSLEAGHGVAVDITSVPDEAGISEMRRGETELDVRTFDASVTYLGFHFYFN